MIIPNSFHNADRTGPSGCSPQAPTKGLINFGSVRSADTWLLATIRLSEPQLEVTDDEIAAHPEQWSWFLWQPSGSGRFSVLPTEWAISVSDAYNEVREVVDLAPVYELQADEVNRALLLDILLVIAEPDDRLRALIEKLRAEARSELRNCMIELYSDYWSPPPPPLCVPDVNAGPWSPAAREFYSGFLDLTDRRNDP